MKITEQHVSPDGLLRLLVCINDTGDISIGLDGYGWHTHADVLASISGLPEDRALRQFINEILTGQSAMAVSRIDGVIQDVWPTDNPAQEMRFKPEEEQIEFRYWDDSPSLIRANP